VRSRSSRRQGADPTYLKRYALHPLVCFVAGLGICLHAKLRRGRVHTAKGLLPFVDECLRRIPGGVGIRARFDSGFYDGKLFEALERRGVTMDIGQRQQLEIFGDDGGAICVGIVAHFGGNGRLSPSRTCQQTKKQNQNFLAAHRIPPFERCDHGAIGGDCLLLTQSGH